MSKTFMQAAAIWVLALTAILPQVNSEAQNILNNQNNFFIENKGQWSPEVKYLARIGGMNAWITTQGVVYDFYKIDRQYDLAFTMHMPKDQRNKYEKENTRITGQVVKMELKGVNPTSFIESAKQKEGYYNYFIGNDRNRWAGNVRMYENVEQQGIYNGINVRYYFDEGMLRYDYEAEPGSNINQIVFRFEGQDGLEVNEKGELVIKTSLGEVTHGKLYAYQQEEDSKEEVSCYFEKKDNGEIGIRADNYNPDKVLIIDPLVYSTFIGGNNWDEGGSLVLDGDGNSIITGFTLSTDFPTTVGAYQTTIAWGDIFVTKLNSNGSGLIYSTFLGGSDLEFGYSLAVESGGAVVLTGHTYSTDYPITAGAYQTVAGGGFGDGFITKLDALGSSLIYSTYLGGGAEDYGFSLALKNDGSVFICGHTASADFPVTANAVQSTIGGLSDAFVARLDATGSSLMYSSFFGGAYAESYFAMTIGSDKSVYLIGKTHSSDFPTTAGAFQTVYRGNSDLFVTKFTPSGNAVLYSTYLGGSGDDGGWGSNGISIGKDGSAFIVGTTNSVDFPTTSGAFQTVNNGGYDVFVTKLNALGSSLVYSTFLGGQDLDIGQSIDNDLLGNVYLTGCTGSTDFPVTVNAFQTFNNGFDDVFVANLDNAGSTLNYSTYLGGSDSDIGASIKQGSDGSVTLTGYTASTDFPVTAGAYQTTFGGIPDDIFLTRMLLTDIPEIIVTFPNLSENLVMGQAYNITWTDNISENVKIELLKADVSERNITASTESDGTFSWTVPNDLKAGNSYKIKIISVAAPSVMDVSDRKFRISTIKNAAILSQNYPNPFNPTTVIKYSVPFDANVRLIVYNTLGEEVAELVNVNQSAGKYEADFNGSGMASGIYIYKLSAVGFDGEKQFTEVKKMSLLK